RRQLSAQQFSTIQNALGMNESIKVKLIVIIQRIKKIHTKRGDSMAFITISDETGEIDAVIFPNLYREVSPILAEESTISIAGKVSIRDQKKQIIIDTLHICDIEEVASAAPGYLYIKLTIDQDEETALEKLRSLAETYKGDTTI